MWSILKSENNAYFMQQNGNIIGKIWDIDAANNPGCIKVICTFLYVILKFYSN